jgi:excisionase family DNA binding protein
LSSSRVLQLGPVEAGYVGAALARYGRELEAAGERLPPAVAEIASTCLRVARSGQSRPLVAVPAHSAGVDALLTYDEAAEAAAVSTRTVRRMVASGVLPARRAGRSVRIAVGDLEAALAAKEA